MKVSITKKTLSQALSYIEKSAQVLFVTKTNGAWTITAIY